MRRRRRCRICHRWFYPHPRAGRRQRVCSDPECQQERHRLDCARWHRQNPGYDRERRLRQKLQAAEPPFQGPAGVMGVDPLRQLDWSAAREAVGLDAAVVVEEASQVVVQWARDSVSAKPLVIGAKTSKVTPPDARDSVRQKPAVITGKTSKVSPSGARDDIASEGPSP